MQIKALGFDIGGTLVNYNKPLNWSASYEDAIRFMCEKNDILFSEKRFLSAKEILTKYNTRINPREKEVTSNVIFQEVSNAWKEPTEMILEAKKDFYLYFQREAFLYDDVKCLLEFCQKNKIKCAVYTDIAYGMDDEFVLEDIREIKDFIDLKLTSGNVGYRKPNKTGFQKMLEIFNCKPQEMAFIGDEQKDIQGAKSIEMNSILINRSNEEKNFGQDYTIKNLNEMIRIIENIKEKELGERI